MITPRFLWAEIERLADGCQASYKAVGSPLPASPSNPEPVVSVLPARYLGDVRAGSERRKARRIGVFGPANQKRAKFTIARPKETEKNTRIIQGLERVYGIEKTKTVLEQAVAMYHVSSPLVQNEPEVYELFETGVLDEALESFGVQWVIGRVKLE